jgi:hypothetical protein
LHKTSPNKKRDYLYDNPSDIIIKGLEIELILIVKSPLAPLFQRGDNSSLWQREVRRDF